MRRVYISSAVQFGSNDYGWDLRQGLQWELGQALAGSEAVKRGVHVRSGISDHIDPPDLELRARCIVLARLLAADVVTDDGSWQAGIGHESVVDLVAEVDELWLFSQPNPWTGQETRCFDNYTAAAW